MTNKPKPQGRGWSNWVMIAWRPVVRQRLNPDLERQGRQGRCRHREACRRSDTSRDGSAGRPRAIGRTNAGSRRARAVDVGARAGRPEARTDTSCSRESGSYRRPRRSRDRCRRECPRRPAAGAAEWPRRPRSGSAPPAIVARRPDVPGRRTRSGSQGASGGRQELASGRIGHMVEMPVFTRGFPSRARRGRRSGESRGRHNGKSAACGPAPAGAGSWHADRGRGLCHRRRSSRSRRSCPR